MSIGSKIEYYRKKACLTQEDLASRLEVSRQTIYKWEADLAKPTYSNLKKLIIILDIHYNDIFEE